MSRSHLSLGEKIKRKTDRRKRRKKLTPAKRTNLCGYTVDTMNKSILQLAALDVRVRLRCICRRSETGIFRVMKNYRTDIKKKVEREKRNTTLVRLTAVSRLSSNQLFIILIPIDTSLSAIRCRFHVFLNSRSDCWRSICVLSS